MIRGSWVISESVSPVYYAQEQDARLVTTIMDHLAGCPDFISLNDLLSAVQIQGVTVDRDELIRVLRLMERDHYLRRNDDGHYQFRFELIKHWWKLDRGLVMSDNDFIWRFTPSRTDPELLEAILSSESP